MANFLLNPCCGGPSLMGNDFEIEKKYIRNVILERRERFNDLIC